MVKTSKEDETYSLTLKGLVHCWKELDISEEQIIKEIIDITKRSFRIGFRMTRAEELEMSLEDEFVLYILEEAGAIKKKSAGGGANNSSPRVGTNL